MNQKIKSAVRDIEEACDGLLEEYAAAQIDTMAQTAAEKLNATADELKTGSALPAQHEDMAHKCLFLVVQTLVFVWACGDLNWILPWLQNELYHLPDPQCPHARLRRRCFCKPHQLRGEPGDA